MLIVRVMSWVYARHCYITTVWEKCAEFRREMAVCNRRVAMWESQDVREGRLPRTVTKLPRDAGAS